MLKQRLDSYATASAGALARALAEGQVSALELFEEAVKAIEAKDGAINAVVVRDFGRARGAAVAADAALARGDRSPLLGVPMTVKEAHDVAGLATTWGLEPHRDWIPPADSTGVTRLKAAGAVILGKTNVATSLGDWQSTNAIYGRTNNPHDLSRSPGGSSGGSSAALAAGMTPLEFGTDIGGSIRVPAHFCGVYGHKPTFGLIPASDYAPPPTARPVDPVAFNVIGPMARTAADLDLALDVLAGPERDAAVGYRLQLPPPRHAALKDFRVLVVAAHPAAALDDEVRGPIETLASHLAQLGAQVSHASPLLPDLAAANRTYLAMVTTVLARDRGATAPLDSLGWLDGQDLIVTHRIRWAELFGAFDVVLAPPFGTVAFTHSAEAFQARRLVINGVETRYGDQIAWPGLATFPGLPSTCAPIGRTPAGLPTGVQVIGPRFEDRTTIAFAGLIAQEFGP
jgi:amidase